MKVLDASTAVDALTECPRNRAALEAISTGNLVAPELVDLEVLSTLARMERAGKLSRADGEKVVADWRAVPIERFALAPLLPRVWELRHYVQVSDAFYAALARSLDCPLITSDGRLARAGIPGLDVRLIG